MKVQFVFLDDFKARRLRAYWSCEKNAEKRQGLVYYIETKPFGY